MTDALQIVCEFHGRRGNGSLAAILACVMMAIFAVSANYGFAQDVVRRDGSLPRLVLLGQNPGGVVDAMDFSPGGSQLAVAVNVGQSVVKIYDIDSGKVNRSLFGYMGEGFDGLITALKFTPDGKWLFVAVKEGADAAIRIYKTDDFGTEDRIDQRIVLQSGGFVRGMAFTEAGDRFVLWDIDNKFQLWALEDSRWRMKREVDFGKSRFLRYVRIMDEEHPLLWVRMSELGNDVHEFWSLDRFENLALVEADKTATYRKKIDTFVKNYEEPFLQTKPVSNTVNRFLDEIDGFSFICMDQSYAVCRPMSPNPGAKLEIRPKPEGFGTLRRFAYDIASNRIALADEQGSVRIEQISADDIKTVRDLKGYKTDSITVGNDEAGLAKGTITWRVGGPRGERLRFDLNQVDVRRIDVQDKPGQLTVTDANPPNRRSGPWSVSFANTGKPLPFLSAEDAKRVGVNFYRGLMRFRDGENPNRNFDIPLDIPSPSLSDAELERTPARFPEVALLGAGHPLIATTALASISVLDPDEQRYLRNFAGHLGSITDLAVSRPGRRLISSATDGTIRIWSLEDHKPAAFPDFLYDPPTEIVLWVPPGSRAATAGIQPGDQWLSMNDIPSLECYRRFLSSFDFGQPQWGFRKDDLVQLKMKREGREFQVEMKLPADEDMVKPLVSIYAEDSLTWAAWTEEGYFQAGPNGGQLIGWVVNRGRNESAVLYTADQFQEFLRQPGAIRSLVKDGDRTFRTLAKEEGFKPFDITRVAVLPELRIVNAVDRTDQERFDLNYRVLGKGTLESLECVVRTKHEVAGRNLVDLQKIRIENPGAGKEMISLRPGLNRVELRGRVRSETGELTDVNAFKSITFEPPARTSFEKITYVLSVGVGRFVDPAMNGFDPLKNTPEDARSFASLFDRPPGPGIDGFEERVEKFVIVEDVAREKILANIRQIVDKIRDVRKDERDRNYLGDEIVKTVQVVVFFSTHGWIDDNRQLRLATSDSRRNGVGGERGLELKDLLSLADEQCQVTLFLDTCHAGAVLDEIARDRDMESAIQGRWANFSLVAAANAQQRAAEGENLSLFMQALQVSARNPVMDTDEDGFVSVGEMEKPLEDFLARLSGGRQKPVFRTPFTQFDPPLFPCGKEGR